jgi:hypothetical protein
LFPELDIPCGKLNPAMFLMIANLAKNNFGDEELFNFCKAVAENKSPQA